MSGNARTLVIKFKFLPHDFDGIAALKKHIGKVINPASAYSLPEAGKSVPPATTRG